MPIKDQCANCRYQEGERCQKLAPLFDGTSCDVYAKRINLDKEDKEQIQVGTPNVETQAGTQYEHGIEQPSDENIHGWLTFFLVLVGLGSVLTLVWNFVSFESDDNFWISATDVAFSLGYFIIGIMTLVAFRKRDTDAVFLAKTYLVFCFVSNFLALFSTDEEIGNYKIVVYASRSILWSCIWFVFLCKSAQVKRLFPSSYRKTQTRDWIIIAITILLPISCIGLAIASEKETRTELENTATWNLSLGDNQFTDGRILLTIPIGVDCEEIDMENIKIFSISDAETGSEVTVVSDYDADATKKNFNKYWRGWKPEELNDIDYDVIKDDKQSYYGTTLFYKLVRVNIENPVYWEFALVFHHESGKVCLISGYSEVGVDSPVTYIIDNLKFL